MSPATANFPTAADIGALLPATIVALTALVALFFDLLAPAATRRILAVLVAAIGLAGAGIVLALHYGDHTVAFDGAFVQGGLRRAVQGGIKTGGKMSVTCHQPMIMRVPS